MLAEEGWQLMDDPYYWDEDKSQLIFKDYSGLLEKSIFRDQSFTQDHYINFSGGNDMGSFVASLGYYKEDGIVRNTAYKRFTGNVKGDYQIKPWLKIRGGAQYTWYEQPRSYYDGDWDDLFYRTRS